MISQLTKPCDRYVDDSFPPEKVNAFDSLVTADGSLTFYSIEFKQHFHNLHGAREEALEKFVLPCRVPLLARQPEVRILDICFGLGYNSGVALELLYRLNPDCRVVLHALERSPDVPLQAQRMGVWSDWDFAVDWLHLIRTGGVQTASLEAYWHGGDARQTITRVPTGFADVVFFDPFAPSACPELWTVDFFAEVARCMTRHGRLSTYSCAAAVRVAMQAVGFHIGSTPPVGRPWPGTIAALTPTDLPALTLMELEHLQTRAAVPYRDPTLKEERDRIRLQRQQAQQQSSFEPTSCWKRRWAGQIASTLQINSS
ncbi:MAG: MnmC family methyltransferase [Cyanobacteria bacterium P01_F01_bin.33]